jgi:hypothetical protein
LLAAICKSLSPHHAPQACRPGSRLRGVPRWCDRFGQYGIKVSFWGSGTLKTVIFVTPRNGVFGLLIITPSKGRGC